jgi:hypothetical protein
MPIKSVYDKGRFAWFVREQFGVISRGQALDCSLSRSRIDYLTRDGGPWQRVLPGVYATTTGTLTREQRDMAALLHAGPRSVITGHTAIGRHNLPCIASNQVDVLLPKEVRVASVGFVRIVRTGRMPQEFYSTNGIRFACLPRAVADAARGMSRLSDVRTVVASAVQRGPCDLPSLITELNQGPKVGSAKLRQALEEVCVGIRSSAEADLKDIIGSCDLEEPLYNPELYAWDGTFIGMPDAWWQRAGVAAEVDSLQYHMSPEDYENTVTRHNRMRAYDINMLHFLPRTLKRDRTTVLADLRGAIEKGSRRPPLPIVAIPAIVPGPGNARDCLSNALPTRLLAGQKRI